MTHRKRLISIGAVLFAACLWGTTGTVQTLLPPDREPLAVGALRLAFGAVFLLCLAMGKPHTRRAFQDLPKGGVISAALAIGAYNLFFFYAVSLAGVGIGTAVTIGSAPVWATAWEVATRRQLPDHMRIFGQGLSVTGVSVLGFAAGGAQGSVVGVILALMAGVCYAAYSLITSRMTHRAPSTTIAAATFSAAAIITLPVLLIVPLAWLGTPSAWGGLVFLGFVATGLAYALYTWGLMRLAASTAVTLALAEPVTAWLLATFFIGEAMTVQGITGTILILVGLVAVTAFPAVTRETSG